jgi:thiamine biosynthesis lipoprotein
MRILRILAIALFFSSLKVWAADPELRCVDQAEMGTQFKICVYVKAADALNLDEDYKKSFEILHNIDGWMSEWRPDTMLSHVNESAGSRPVKVSKDLFDVIQYALEAGRITDGAFDITFNAFWGLYNFKPGLERAPTEKEIKERLPLVNFRNVVTDSKNLTVFLRKPGMKIGLGGLGQGYGVEQVLKYLKPKYSAGYIDGSGDTYFWGKKPSGELWLAAIRDPRDNAKIVARIYLTDAAVTTSGDDEKFFVQDGKRYHHIIDPKTGYPATKAHQVTVVSRSAFEADTFDTASLVMGPEKAFPILKKRGMEAVIVTDKGVMISSGLKNKTTLWGEVLVWEPDTTKSAGPIQ